MSLSRLASLLLGLWALSSGLWGCLLFSTVQSPCVSAAECDADQVCLDGTCQAGADAGPLLDGGQSDGGAVDGGPVDAGPLDGGPDAGALDAGRDGGERDGGEEDGGEVEPLGEFPLGWTKLSVASDDDSRCLDSGRLPRDVAASRSCAQDLTTQWRAVEVEPGGYTLHVRYQGSHRCLDGNVRADDVAFVGPCRPVPDQVWSLAPIAPTGAAFQLRNNEGGADQCLTQVDASLRMQPCQTALPEQEWRIEVLAIDDCLTFPCTGSEVCDFINGACAPEAKEQYCHDGVDEDENGRADCADLACVARAECLSPVTLPNPSFETFDSSNGVPTPATGWTCNGGAGGCGSEQALIGQGFFNDDTDGDRYHFLNLPTFSEFDPSVTETNPGTIGTVTAGFYWLQVAVGRRLNGETTNNRIDIAFLAGDQRFAETPVVNPRDAFGAGTWNDVDAAAIVLPASGEVGRDLRLRFEAHGGTFGRQAQIDHVRLQHSVLGELVLEHGSFEGPLNGTGGIVDGWTREEGAGLTRTGPVGALSPADGLAMVRLVKPSGTERVVVRQAAGDRPLAQTGVYGIKAQLSRGDSAPSTGTVSLSLVQVGAGPVVTAVLDLEGPNLASDDWYVLAAAKTLRVEDPVTAGELVVEIAVDSAGQEVASAEVFVDDVQTFFTPLP